MGNLPLEMIAMIFQHLEIYQIFQARRVSSKWLRCLSASAITDPLLQQWDAMGQTPLRISEVLEPRSMASYRAEHIDAYRRGLAFSRLAYAWEFQPTAVPDDFVCADGKLAWIDETRKVLRVLDLEHGTTNFFIPQNRETLHQIAISMFIVVALTTSGKCYVWELSNGRAHSFRLLRYGDHLFAGIITLAILHRSKSPSHEYVTTWSLETQNSFTFPVTAREGVFQDVNKQRGSQWKEIILYEQSIVVFEHTPDTNTLWFKRSDLTGHVQASGSLDIGDTSAYIGANEYEHFTRSARFYTVWSLIPSYEVQASRNESSEDVYNDRAGLLRVVFDLKQDCLRFECHFPRLHQNIFQDERLYRIPQHDHEENYINDSFIYKDIAYYRAPWAVGSWAEGGLKVIDLTNGTCNVADMDRYTSEDFERFPCCAKNTGTDGYQALQSRLLGDGIYLVEISAGGFVAWCFDKQITMANEDRGYRVFRENLISERIRPRRERSGATVNQSSSQAG